LPEPPPPQYTLQQAGFWYPHFDTDSYRLSKSNEQMLSTLAEYLKQHEEIEHLEIRGYADDTGKETYNLALSEKRAAAVQQWLLEREVAAARLLSRHFGESAPASQGKTPQARAMNRRVELEFHYREAPATPSAANTVEDQVPEQSAE
jgi:outer membrane protein OmpA-like peptidoglycan-associated protein